MEFKTTSSPHLEDKSAVSRVMLKVMLALIPGIGVALWLFGWGVLTNLILASVFAVLFEAAVLMLRQRPLARALSDNSALLTAWLLALAMPPMSSWWLLAIGLFFAIVIAKQLFGGLGQNPFNPAMVGYVVLLISFPTQMSRWLSPADLAQHSLTLAQTLDVVFAGVLPQNLGWDALSGATLLDASRIGLGLGQDMQTLLAAQVGYLGGHGWEWLALAYAGGGLWLVYLGLVDWRTPLAMLLGIALPALLFSLLAPEHYLPPLLHLLSGAAIFGAFFIASDPVSGCTSVRGRIVFAAGAGLLTWIIRTWGGYPDGVAFAILLMNMAAPTIDYYTRPKVYGARKGS